MAAAAVQRRLSSRRSARPESPPTKLRPTMARRASQPPEANCRGGPLRGCCDDQWTAAHGRFGMRGRRMPRHTVQTLRAGATVALLGQGTFEIAYLVDIGDRWHGRSAREVLTSYPDRDEHHDQGEHGDPGRHQEAAGD